MSRVDRNARVRQGSLISPWGVGQMVNFPGDISLMVAGLDAWNTEYARCSGPEGIDEFIIREPRLEKRLGVASFRLPPDHREIRRNQPNDNTNLYVPSIRFPRWHYCHYCGFMKKLSIYESSSLRCEGPKYEKGYTNCATRPPMSRPTLIPIRFIAICGDGHVQDFPFPEWAHKGNDNFCDSPENLRYEIRNAMTPLGSIRITCSCGKSNTLAGSFNDDALEKYGISCGGYRPWIGETEEIGNYNCINQKLRVVQRGGANVYFPDIRSAIFVPDTSYTDERIDKIVETKWEFISATKDGEIWEDRIRLIAELYGVDFDKLFKAVLARKNYYDTRSDEQASEEQFRKAEYDGFIKLDGEQSADFYINKPKLSLYQNTGNWLKSVGLVHKLRETRALVGFSRLNPDDGKNLEQRKSMLVKPHSEINWLPAIIVRGEGIFLEFDNQLLNEWENSAPVKQRVNRLVSQYNQFRLELGQESRNISARMILLHTFSHLLINQFGILCGYGSASLRERIYCGNNALNTMNGILIYTASGDSEGSMGGLVYNGKPGYLEKIIQKALNGAQWCSSDPVCSNSNGQGPGSCNLAACHNCAILPETSCEERNMLLDRGLITGTLENAETSFFKIGI